MPWTARDRTILRTLTLKVKFLSLAQLQRTWWNPVPAGRATARQRLAVLQAEGFLTHLVVQAHPELLLTTPVHRWHPGDPEPDYGALSYGLKSRWTQPLARTTLYRATAKAAKHFGGAGGKLQRLVHITHDLHVSTVYLYVLATDPALAESWISEAALAPSRRHQKLPDALLRHPAGGPDLVIEFGGAYGPERVRDHHQDCAARGLPYELW